MTQTRAATAGAGSIRAKNAQNILLKNVMDACIGAIMWWATERVPTNVPHVRSDSNSYSTPPPTRVRYISERSRESRRSRSIDPQLSAYSQDSKQKMDVEAAHPTAAKTA